MSGSDQMCVLAPGGVRYMPVNRVAVTTPNLLHNFYKQFPNQATALKQRAAADEMGVISWQNSLKMIEVIIGTGRPNTAAAASLMGIGQRQVFRLRPAFATAGPSGLASKKRGRPGDHRHGATFRRAVLTLVCEQYADFGRTLASEKLAERQGIPDIDPAKYGIFERQKV